MSRRGYTLIEMLAVIGAGSVVMGIVGCVLHLLMQSEQVGRAHVHQARVVARLAEQFRSDVCAASRYTAGGGNKRYDARFVFADNRAVTYEVSEGEVVRCERLSSKKTYRETYVLPDGCTAAIKMDKKAVPPVVSLVVASEKESLTAMPAMNIVAILGKDLRFAKKTVGSE